MLMWLIVVVSALVDDLTVVGLSLLGDRDCKCGHD